MVELSIALITYNSELYIHETLKSLLKQKCAFDYEIVVGDDGSTDNTFEILQSYKRDYPNVFNIKKNEKQLGILHNFKTTIDRCVGKYVFNFDGDDIVKSPFAFEKLVAVFRNKPHLGFVDSGYDKYFEAKNKTQYFVNKNSITASKTDYKNYIFLGKIIPIGTCFNRSLLMKYVDFETYIAKNVTIEDYPTLVDMVANCDFERINESLFIYRIHDKSYSYQTDFENYFFLRQEMLGLFNYFKSKYHFKEDLSEVFHQKYYKTILYLAGSYEKKDLGKEMFAKIKTKNSYDYIHYLASQYKIIRKLVGLRKTKNLILQKIRLALN
ncbi:glycosyltransferase family 2 protein [Aestuariivivens sediminis]|uniref:glycosyltransferase family 2 protein n=1 Tax=Aestuariivivens sediminis TaxID=2913557 RepID=UPI001F57C137|nr:glycosyltransferase family 2 protein [Aestuariivivens sediminis]